MAETFYVDITEDNNIDCVLDGIVELADNVSNAACIEEVAQSTTVFSVVAGVNTINATALGGNTFSAGSKIIIRLSVDSTGLINNDGCYTVADPNIDADTITVVEDVIACTSASAIVTFDEFVTFILHPTKSCERMLVYIHAESTLATFDVSFEPGDYWAAKEELARPVYQGSGVANGKYLFLIETARYLKDVSKEVAIDGTEGNDVETRGCILMRVFPGTSADLIAADEINVACIML